MLSEKEVSLVFETLLSSPGMNDLIKMDLRIPRKNALLVAKAIERGLHTKPGESLEGLLQAAGTGSLEAVQQIGLELLQKAGLSEMNEKLQTLQPRTK